MSERRGGAGPGRAGQGRAGQENGKRAGLGLGTRLRLHVELGCNTCAMSNTCVEPGCHKDIGGPEVSVQNAQSMQVVQPSHDLPHDLKHGGQW